MLRKGKKTVELGIEWNIPEDMEVKLSEKDKKHPGLSGLDFAFDL